MDLPEPLLRTAQVLQKKIAEDSSESDRGKAVSHKIKTMCTVRLKSNLELQSCSHCINFHFPYKSAPTNKKVMTNCTLPESSSHSSTIVRHKIETVLLTLKIIWKEIQTENL